MDFINLTENLSECSAKFRNILRIIVYKYSFVQSKKYFNRNIKYCCLKIEMRIVYKNWPYSGYMAMGLSTSVSWIIHLISWDFINLYSWHYLTFYGFLK